MQVVERNGRVAVLVSRGYGAGWFSWNSKTPECLYHPEIVALVESLEDADWAVREETITPVAKRLFGEDFYAGGADGLTIQWLDPGTAFRIEEYDGAESLVILAQDRTIQVVPSVPEARA